MKLNWLLVLLMIVFGVALAVISAPRLSTDVVAVMIGTGVGMVASVPVSLTVIVLIRREERARRR